MKAEKVLYAVDSHTGGEPTRVILDGTPKLRGNTMGKLRDDFEANHDELRKSVVREPRGHRDMVAAFILEPLSEMADVGVIFADSDGYLDMCGHGSMGVATVLLETGFFTSKEPETKICLQTPAGLVNLTSRMDAGSVKQSTLTNVPAFLYKQDHILKVKNLGEIPVDIAFGGDWYILVSAESLGTSVSIDSLDALVRKERFIRKAAGEQVDLDHPDPGVQPKFNGTMIYDLPTLPEANAKEVVIFGRSSVDRSPCGTGTSARMATLYAKGKLGFDQDFVHESITGSTFRCRLTEEVKLGVYKAVRAEITGSAYITGFQQLVIDPDDPFKNGFLLY